MGSVVEEQSARIVPPRKNSILAITLDTTARAYEIDTINLGDYTPEQELNRRAEVMITIQTEGADLFFYFHTATDAALDRTAAQAAAAGLAAFNATYAAYLPAGNERTYTIDRTTDRFLVVQGSAAGKVRVFASSVAAT